LHILILLFRVTLSDVSKILTGALDMKDLPWHPNLPWVFAHQAQADISSVERHGTRLAHQTTMAAALTDKLLHLSSPKS
jgi:hypothetical protein